MTFDEDGYPTGETLDEIQNFDIMKPRPLDRLPDLIRLIRDHWWGGDCGFTYNFETGCLELHTLGWSGNESIIMALKKTRMFWSLFWVKSTRGGHYWFRLYQWEEDGITRKIPRID